MPRWFLAIFQVKRRYWLAFIPNVLPGTRFLVCAVIVVFQLEAALTHIAEEGRGILIYHRQEGRNIGLLNKIRAYALQDQGYDTVEANHQLGFAADERDFTLCADMFKLLGVDEVRLLTNNPKKVEILTEAGINIVERVPLIVGRNPNNEHYLDTKAAKMGHLLSK